MQKNSKLSFVNDFSTHNNDKKIRQEKLSEKVLTDISENYPSSSAFLKN